MSTHLAITDEPRDCESCGTTMRGLVAWTQQINPTGTVPICGNCLVGIDPRLAAILPIAQAAFTLQDAARALGDAGVG